jgi:hypothetical protein
MFVNLVSKTTAVTFAAIILGTLLLAWRISQTVRISVAQGAPTRGSLDKIVYTIVAVRFGAERFAHHTLQRLQSPESTRVRSNSIYNSPGVVLC